jgi:cysteinyl-tRNA synthetase
MLYLHNTLSGKVEHFDPINKGQVLMYSCGPTVYDYAHIGNLRAFFTPDLLRRFFEYQGVEVKHVMNITDVGIGGDNDEGEDKIIRGLKREGKPVTLEAMKELTDFYTDRFKEDISSLNILMPHVLPRASEHIAEDISLIESLEEKGFTYRTSDGIYFDTAKDSNYGKLGGTGGKESRIAPNSEKHSQKDFALWKFNSSLGYESPWGQGFPGWHIECSAMSTKYLGQPFDIHTGGIDLAPIHHNNEIAQSENACNCEYAHYWVHNGFVNVSGDKMAKSEGNILTLKTLSEKGFSPLSYRYFLLLSHYRSPTNFTWDALQAAENALNRLRGIVRNLKTESKDMQHCVIVASYKKEFLETLGNDLNTPEALAVVWKLIKDDTINSGDKLATLLDLDKALGLDLGREEAEIPEEIRELIQVRDHARLDKNWAESDRLRDEIESRGYIVEDTDSGTRVNKR